MYANRLQARHPEDNSYCASPYPTHQGSSYLVAGTAGRAWKAAVSVPSARPVLAVASARARRVLHARPTHEDEHITTPCISQRSAGLLTVRSITQPSRCRCALRHGEREEDVYNE